MVKATVQDIAPGTEVILYGSRARGDARSDSDWDFLILVEGEVNHSLKRAVWKRLYEPELGTEAVIHSLITDNATWLKADLWPIKQEVRREGQKV